MAEGVSPFATIMEQRSETAEVLEAAKGNTGGVMIQKNTQPEAALISWEPNKQRKAGRALDEIDG